MVKNEKKHENKFKKMGKRNRNPEKNIKSKREKNIVNTGGNKIGTCQYNHQI